MPLVLPLDKVTEQDRNLVGGKGFSLARLAGAGFTVPRSLCITTAAYVKFIAGHGLAERIQLEFNRKNFADMRWEEMWDTALRIRHLFLTQPMPHNLEQTIGSAVESTFGSVPVAIRSSAPDEDARSSSFAGLHESFIHISGTAAILDHIKLVWASLWSDAALLYRQELGLDTEKSSMGVLVQEVIHGRSSGILFTRSPDDPGKAVIESVHGLNQALVDGTIEPDRWFISRDERTVQFSPARRSQYMTASAEGTELIALPADLQNQPPLAEKEVSRLLETGLVVEKLYDCPQDIEWTYAAEKLVILQSRPISTAGSENPLDRRPWYLSLHRSLENLRTLRAKIENTLLPAMVHDAERLAEIDLPVLTNEELADEIARRFTLNEKWTAVYWEEFIPFAHGMRLFGQVYNDSVKPDNPYEFMELLVSTPLESMNRNTMMQGLADRIRNNPGLRNQLEKGVFSDFADDGFQQLFNEFIGQYGDFSCSLGLEDHCRSDLKTLMAVLLETASHPSVAGRQKKLDRNILGENYLHCFPEEKLQEAREILELGRASYRLRDDDNIYLGRIELHVANVLEEGHRRLEHGKRIFPGEQLEIKDCMKALRDPDFIPARKKSPISSPEQVKSQARARQLVGQPAGPGMAQGKALVVNTIADLARISKGDVLVCDAIEPNMTFVVPLAGAIVERRGGMLIHGAIIAREYGIPCVTGITDATTLIHSGDRINVDGYLGIVTISRS
ncbi:MAG: PEP-utilizing enzyme [Desulfobulbaceae bacterium]|nr:PEP-utilizing enzyme [Desulfobulbaceae bacterium]